MLIPWKRSSFRAASFSFIALLLMLFHFSFHFVVDKQTWKIESICVKSKAKTQTRFVVWMQWMVSIKWTGWWYYHKNEMYYNWLLLNNRRGRYYYYYLMKNVCSQQDSIIAWWNLGQSEYVKSLQQTFATIEISDFKTPKYLVKK